MSTHLSGAEIVGTPGPTDYLFAARALAAERDGQPEQALAILLEMLDPESTRLFPHLSHHPDRCLWPIDAVRLAIAVAEAATEACSAEAQPIALPVPVAAAQHLLRPGRGRPGPALVRRRRP